MIHNYLKTAWRNLLHNKMIAGINILGLSIGMTAAMLIFLWVQNERHFDDDHNQVSQIYRVTTNLKEYNWIWEQSPLLLAPAAVKAIPEIEYSTRLSLGYSAIYYLNGVPTHSNASAYVDSSWFHLFSYHFLEGSGAGFGNNPYSLILTASEAKKYFGNQSAVGKTIHVDSLNYEVKGVVTDPKPNSSFQFQVFVPLDAFLKDSVQKANDQDWGNANYITFVKLKNGADVNSVGHKITRLMPDNPKESTTYTLQSLTGMHFENDTDDSSLPRGDKSSVLIFSIFGFLLLLIACINYVNLTTAKASLRVREVSVRKIIGAKRIQLFYQFITESMLISFITLFVTIALMQISIPLFNSMTGKNFQLSLTSVSMWQVISLTLLAAFLLNSIYPALLLSSIRPLAAFRGFSLSKLKDSHFRKGLVVLQFSISVALIAGTIVIYRQLYFVQHKDPGYSRAQTLTFRAPAMIERNKKEMMMQTFKQELSSRPGIEGVSLANQSIVDIGSMSTGSADWDGHDTSFNPKITQLSTDADYQKLLGLHLKEGRWFLPLAGEDKNNVILNETAIATLNIRKPYLGQRFKFKGRTGQIIGIVKDFYYKSLHSKISPLVVFRDPDWYNSFMVKAAPNQASTAISAIEKEWASVFPGQPLEYSFLDETFNRLYERDQQTSSLIFAFAIVGIVLSCLGLFGLAAFTAAQRTKEIGIRKVLGATVSNITVMLSGNFVKLVMISILIGVPVAYWAMNEWLQSFAYRIDLSWWMFALAGASAILIALLTISFQAVKAAIANPAHSLRSE